MLRPALDALLGVRGGGSRERLRARKEAEGSGPGQKEDRKGGIAADKLELELGLEQVNRRLPLWWGVGAAAGAALGFVRLSLSCWLSPSSSFGADPLSLSLYLSSSYRTPPLSFSILPSHVMSTSLPLSSVRLVRPPQKIAGNLPGAAIGAFGGSKLGAVRDAKGKAVYQVFQVGPVSLFFSSLLSFFLLVVGRWRARSGYEGKDQRGSEGREKQDGRGGPRALN